MEKEFSKEEMVKEAVEEAKKAAKEQQTEMEETSEEVTCGRERFRSRGRRCRKERQKVIQTQTEKR